MHEKIMWIGKIEMVTDEEALGILKSKGYTCYQCGKPLLFILRETYPEGLIFDGNCGDETHDVPDYFVPSGEVRRTMEEQLVNLSRLSQNDLEDRVRYAIDAGLVNGMDYRSISREEIISRIKNGDNWSSVLW
jgi:hypothetical protein